MTRARKRFGQHFLEPAWVDKLVAAVAPAPDQRFLEIGPGRGALTRPLAARAESVTAVEIDRDLAADLRAEMPANVAIVEGDFLDTAIQSALTESIGAGRPLRVVGNLPYNVASPILFSLVDWYGAGMPLADATVMLQREVADRLLAAPGSKTFGAMTVLVGLEATVQRVLNLPAGAFRPMPKVLSSVVRLRFHPPDPPVASRQLFRDLVQAVFSHRRKTIANAVRAFDGGRRLPEWLDPGRRPETLGIGEFARLADDFSR